jgi:hypothetical protein
MPFADHHLRDVPALSILYDREQALVAVTPMGLQRHAASNEIRHPRGRRARQSVFSRAAGVKFGRIEPHNPDALSPASKRVAVDSAASRLRVHRDTRQQELA